MFINFPHLQSIIKIFFIFKSPEVKVDQTLLCKLKLDTFESSAFDCYVELQLKSEAVFKFETFCAQSFNISFSAPEAREDPIYGIYVVGFMLVYVMFLRETS